MPLETQSQLCDNAYDIALIEKNRVAPNGLYTLSDTKTNTYIETDNKYTELNGNLCCYLSSVQCEVFCIL